MFLWIRIKVESHPSFPQLSPEEISHKVFLSLIDNLVLVSPSTYFKAPGGPAWSKEEEAKRIYLRLSFSLPTDDEMEEGAKRMAAGLRKEWQLE
jgi:aromatic amino acid aminotransferase I